LSRLLRRQPSRNDKRGRYALLFFATLILLLTPIAFFTLNKPIPTEANWFDPGFSFRKDVPITNSSGEVQTDFQVEVTFDTQSLIATDKLQSQCQDIRFTDSSGKQLKFWIEPNTCDTTSTKIWVLVPSIPTSGADLFLYYGNPPSPPSPSSPQDIFIKEMDI